MSKRNHLTDLGCIACEELSEIGADREGWLDDPAILCAVDDHSVTVANKYVLLILGWSDLGEPRVKIRPDFSPIEAEHITAIEWLVLDDFRVIAVGTSRGYLLIYSLSGHLIHRQIVYSGRILKLRVRGLKEGFNQETTSGEVCVVMPSVIARFDATDIQAMLRRWYEETSSQFWEQKSKKKDPEETGHPSGRLPYQLWNVTKYGNIVDAGITGVMPPPLMELQLLLLLGSQVNVTSAL